jgi:nitrate/nitrite transporter NarK
MGMLLGVFGAASLACYAPGGWLADRFYSRKLITLATVISSWSAVIFLCGVAAWFVLEDDAPSNRTDPDCQEHKVGWKAFGQALRMPAVWLIAIVINATNSGFWVTYYFTPYASEVFVLSVAAAGLISVGRNWLNPLAPFVSGFVADRFGISRTSTVLLLLVTFSFALFTVTPARTSLLPLVLLNGAVAALAIYALRGIYFALLDEQRIPAAVTGTAAGIASLIGFTSDIYMPAVSGAILDKYPGLPGYRVLFGATTLIVALGAVAAWQLVRNRRTLTSQ